MASTHVNICTKGGKMHKEDDDFQQKLEDDDEGYLDEFLDCLD